MADQSDVENALVSAITNILYPSGSSSGGVLTQTVKIYRGWPNTASLRTDLAAGTLNVTVFPKADTSRNTTRWAEGLVSTGGATPSLTVNVTGPCATFAGSADTGQLAGLLVDLLAVVHRTVTGDTPELVAAVLAELIRTRRIAVVAGATITVPGGAAGGPNSRGSTCSLLDAQPVAAVSDQLLVPGPNVTRQRCVNDRQRTVLDQLHRAQRRQLGAFTVRGDDGIRPEPGCGVVPARPGLFGRLFDHRLQHAAVDDIW